MSNQQDQPAAPGNEPTGPPPRDELDDLLRQWHTDNTEQAAAGRDALMAKVRAERRTQDARAKAPGLGEALLIFFSLVRRAIMNRYSPVAVSALAIVVVIAVLIPGPSGQVYAREIMVPDAGRLDALDEEGNILGPCPLEHTEVDAQISGFFSRVNITQTYHNPYERKIEAVYTFPLSHRAAVDRMTMTVGDRVVVGEVKERELARQIYEAARTQGYVASLLEQERPNIFTQSVANLESGAVVTVKISYVEILAPKDGTYRFDFPMVVGPRYIPGASVVSPSVVPAELEPRQGLVLLGPARLTVGAAGELNTLGSLQAGKLQALIKAAKPIKYPGDTWWGRGDATGGAGQAMLWYRFEAQYCNGARELGELYTDGTGQLNGRWFYVDAKTIQDMGAGYAQNTNEVPDASRITPMPVKPDERAGHDISVSVTIDTGGPGLLDIEPELHKVVTSDEVLRDDDLPRKVTLTLAKKKDIPNRDFVLSWRQTSDTIQEATFAHTSAGPGDGTDGFFTLILQPPDRVEDAVVPPRELIFVMDTSGSMRGFPLDKSKAVMTRAINAMRPADTFNVITFAGRTRVLWDKPRPATEANRAEARALVEKQQGGGGTEMMQAINNALIQTAGDGPVPLTPRMLANLPADNRPVDLVVGYERLHTMTGEGAFRIPVGDDVSIMLRL
ncbi:MAG: VIT domain-containing protein, partial [Planctomycetota bacterium]